MKQDNVIKILFIEDAVEDAEQVISLLRNHGVAVRPARAANPDELEKACQELTPDVVLVNPDTRQLTVADAARRMETSGKDFALVALVTRMDDDIVGDMFEQGVHGIALRSRPEQLVQVVRREFDALGMRRSVRRLKNALRESERRCDALLASSRDPIAYVHDGMHVRANQAYLEIFGYDSFEDIEGLTLLDMVAPEHAAAFKGLLKRLAKGEKPPERIKLKALRADSEVFDASVEFSQATFEGEACLQIVFRRQVQVVDAALKEQLLRDPATGLFHRTHMLKLIDDAISAAADGEAGQALLLVEPDNWKTVIGNIGMANTDNLMATIATRITESLGEHAVAGRLGERTIGILLDHHSDEQVNARVDALHKLATDSVFEAGAHSITLTFGIGGSLLGERNASTQLLLEQADEALRSAQSRGVGASQIHDPAARDKAEAERERQWLELVQRALTEEGFVLYQQQIISLQDADGDFSEILLRMEGPNGEVTPGYFLPVAERNGLMSAVDRWVIQRAINMLAERKNEAQAFNMFVKLSAQSLTDPTLVAWLREQLQANRLKQGALVLEMPESKVLTSLKPAQAFVSQLKPLGVAFALEQFGSGLNSFQLLRHVDADYLKIDRNFMADLPQQEDNRAKIADICRQARELNKITVAEWVEDAASTSILFACGVDFVQGNFLREPEKVLTAGGAGRPPVRAVS
ncbi:MAG TPA: EAL domain-containing protein [Rhodanobacteraceae bacterium]|nr:EAL domain-containing protein [Rhodanobacteraceae bacterium]